MTRLDKKELLLVWQDTNTRLRHVIGRLSFKKGKYYFHYEKEGLASAIKQGYQLHPSFPYSDRIYRSDQLFPAFKRRLPDKKRPDYENLLKRYGLTQQASDFEILERTGGKLATDSYEFVTAFSDCKLEKLNHEFYLAGWKYWEGPYKSLDNLKPGTVLKIVPEPDNKYDKFALQVYTSNNVKLGYVPAFYSKHVYHYIAKGCNIELSVVDFNPKRDSSEVLKLNLTCDGKCP